MGDAVSTPHIFDSNLGYLYPHSFFDARPSSHATFVVWSRYDNMQPNVFFDRDAGKWRAWYSTMSECGGNITGPGTDPNLPPDCQALPSNCSEEADPDWHWRDIQRAGVFAYAESADERGLEWTKPNLGLTEWPKGSGDTDNNIISSFGFGSTGGCGTGITLDVSSGAVVGPSACQSWVASNFSDCRAYESGARPAHTTCGGGAHHEPGEMTLAACRAACSADTSCETIQFQGAAATNFSLTQPGQCNLFPHCTPSPYSGSHGAEWCMQIETCVRAGRQKPKTKFKMFGESGSEPFFAESNDGVNFTHKRTVTIPNGRFDTHKNVVFDLNTRKWIGYVRCSPSHNLRVQCYIESETDNFTDTTWSSPMPTGLNSSTFYQPDALVAFFYAPANVWLGFANAFNPSGPGKGAFRRDGLPGQAPVGQVRGVLAWSPNGKCSRSLCRLLSKKLRAAAAQRATGSTSHRSSRSSRKGAAPARRRVSLILTAAASSWPSRTQYLRHSTTTRAVGAQPSCLSFMQGATAPSSVRVRVRLAWRT